ncbi:MAG TPA: acyclic terpene utilization AtuA family protein [Pirellulaceae bacterium]|nr:acyclic terpene utilization AtuA family protein [Pirellulaceae bacterium]
MMPPLRIANGAGFLGDWPFAPRQLVEQAEIDYLTIEHLAELTMSILARQREKNPEAGYAADFLDILRSLTPALKAQPKLKIIANSGGMNPEACAREASKVLLEAGLIDMPLAIVSGDDLLPQLDDLVRQGCDFANLETGEPLSKLLPNQSAIRNRGTHDSGSSAIASANAYLGARPIAEALSRGARIVITGRVADASLTVGPCMHEFGWAWDDWQKLAAASVAGHLIECGAQVTGGYSTQWSKYDLANVGYPIAEIDADGNTTITKPAGTGGSVNRTTVAEQLVYEIGNPRHYLTPDVDCDFTTVELEETGPDRVAVRGATGRAATDTYKVSLAYRDGFLASGQLLVYGPDCAEKAKACGEIILARVKAAGYELARTNVELLGYGAGVPGAFFHRKYQPPGEVVLRVTAHDPRREAIECFARQFAPLITSGPAGLAGYASGRPDVRPVFAYWPTLVPKRLVEPRVKVQPVREWL